MYLSQIPRLERRRHYATAHLAWLIDKTAQVHGWKSIYKRPSDALPAFAEQDDSLWTFEEALGLQLALDKGWLTQKDWDELEACGYGLDEYERALQGGE